MRIAVFHDLPAGGAKRALYETTRWLAARHHVEVYACSSGDETFCDLRPLIHGYHRIAYAPSRMLDRPVGRLNPVLRRRDLGRLDGLARRSAAAIDACGYDVVLAEPSQWTQAPLVLSHLATAAVYDFQEPPRALYEPGLNRRGDGVGRRILDRFDPLPRFYRARARRFDWNATRAARRVLVNSRFTGEQVRRIYGVEPRLVYPGVDVEHFRPAPAEARRNEVLSVGSLQPSKGFDFLIRALAEIPTSERPSLRLVAGTEAPGERGFLSALAERLGVALEIELGIDDRLLARRYSEAALLVYAPHREPFGLAPLEAMASATPVVAVAEGGVPESVQDEVTGLLVGRDAREFAGAVRRLLGDADARRRFGDSGREQVCRHWTWQIRGALVEAELAEMLEARVSTRGG